MKKTLLLCFLVFLSVFTGCETAVTGRVVDIADGDTMTILTRDSRQLKVRLHGVDCPEKKQDFGTKARQYTSELIFGHSVRVEVMDRDRYGRSVGIVILPDGRNLNEELLRAGMAWHYKQYDRSPKFAALEFAARKMKTGLWSMDKPIAPWEFRKMRSKPASRESDVKSDYASDASRCNAPTTTTGAPCQRLVKGGGRCYQHS
ncbi:MAG TPA: thermonuclease family protein [Sphingobacteriaceae bacterium]